MFQCFHKICLWLVPCSNNWKNKKNIQKGMNAEPISTLYSQRLTDERNLKEPCPSWGMKKCEEHMNDN